MPAALPPVSPPQYGRGSSWEERLGLGGSSGRDKSSSLLGGREPKTAAPAALAGERKATGIRCRSFKPLARGGKGELGLGTLGVWMCAETAPAVALSRGSGVFSAKDNTGMGFFFARAQENTAQF